MQVNGFSEVVLQGEGGSGEVSFGPTLKIEWRTSDSCDSALAGGTSRQTRKGTKQTPGAGPLTTSWVGGDASSS